MPDGFRIADAFVGLTLDRDQLRRDLAGLPGELDAEVDAAGHEMGARLGDAAGERISRGIGDGVGNAPVSEPATRKGTEAGDRFGSSFTSKVRAALSALPPVDINLDDEYAQAKLDYIREELTGLGNSRIGIDVSDTEAIAKLTALRVEMDELRASTASVQVKVDTAGASAQIDKFLADTVVKSDLAGKEAGKKLGGGMASSAGSMSPLIVSAIAGGLIAGGPVISAASVLLFGGISAAVAAQSPAVKAQFAKLMGDVKSDLKVEADQLAPVFTGIVNQADTAFRNLEPTIHQAMQAGGADVAQLADAFEGAATTGVGAFTRALQQGQPVVEGLDTLVRDLGSGVAGMMDEITAHSGAEGAVLSDLGQTIQILLPAVGQLLGEGAELGRDVLPVVNTALQWTSDVLHVLAPELPAIATGFAAFKIVGTVTGWLDLLSAKMQTVAADSEGLASKLSGRVAGAASSLSSALPVVGAVLAGVGIIMERSSQQADQWAQDLLKGGQAADLAKTQMSNFGSAMQQTNTGFGGFLANLAGFGVAAGNTALAIKGAKDQQKAMYDQMSPLEQKQQDVTQATNDLQYAIQKYGDGSGQAAGAAVTLSEKEAALASFQNQVKTATEGASAAQETNAQKLQDMSNKASSANTQINLLKSALDALTGKAMTADQAQIAVTQALQAAATATQGMTGRLTDLNGEVDLHSQKGTAAATALMNLASVQHNEIAVLEQQGWSTSDVSARSDELRQQFIQTAEQMGFNAWQAENLANRYYGIPGDINTQITLAVPNLSYAENSINYVARSRTVDIYGVYHGTAGTMGMNAAGGKVSDTPLTRIAFGDGGKVTGPGGPTDDLIQVLGPRSDVDYRLSNDETIVKGSSSRKYGDAKMAAINDGTAVVSLPGPQPAQRYATDGSSDSGSSRGGLAIASAMVTLSFPNVTTIADPNLPRQLLVAIQQGLVKLERESH